MVLFCFYFPNSGITGVGLLCVVYEVLRIEHALCMLVSSLPPELHSQSLMPSFSLEGQGMSQRLPTSWIHTYCWVTPLRLLIPYDVKAFFSCSLAGRWGYKPYLVRKSITTSRLRGNSTDFSSWGGTLQGTFSLQTKQKTSKGMAMRSQ